MAVTSPPTSTDGLIVRAAAKLSVALNIPPNVARDRVLAEILVGTGWTADEVRAAEVAILSDPELLAMIRRAGAVTVEPFAEVRRRREAAPVLGPCFTFDCRRPGTVAAWGDVYCRPCYEGHVQRQRARDRRLCGQVDADAAPRPLSDLLDGYELE